jgi:hypothetical protein
MNIELCLYKAKKMISIKKRRLSFRQIGNGLVTINVFSENIFLISEWLLLVGLSTSSAGATKR